MQPDRILKVASPGERPRFIDSLDLYRLRAFQTMVDEGTMSKASERLLLTQPAVSAHIKALEAGLGVSLFDRVGRRLIVNSAGRVLYEKAQYLFSVADELTGAMEEFRGTSMGRLRLGTSVVWQYRLAGALDSFSRRYPHVELSTKVADSDRIERLVLDRSLDIGFVGRASSRAELVSEHLADDEVVPICSPTHRLATAGSKGIESLRGESLVVREAGSATRQATDQLLAALGIGSKTMMELGSQEAIKRVVMAGRGVGIVTKTGLEGELRSGLLTLARVPGRYPQKVCKQSGGVRSL